MKHLPFSRFDMLYFQPVFRIPSTFLPIVFALLIGDVAQEKSTDRPVSSEVIRKAYNGCLEMSEKQREEVTIFILKKHYVVFSE